MDQLAPLHSNDMNAQNLNDSTVRFTVYCSRGEKSKDFKRDDKTGERVAKWIRREKLGDADEHDVTSTLRHAT